MDTTKQLRRKNLVLTEPVENIFHLRFPNQHLMCSTLLRFQEHYESPRYKGQTFTLEEYMDYYAEKYGDFTYFTDYGGFNFPSKTLNDFYACNFEPLSVKEKKILDLFASITNEFYVIASCGDEETFIHEMAHGLYHINPKYRKNVKSILKGANFNSYYEYLDGLEYRKEFYLDEVQAILIEEATKKKSDKLTKQRKELLENYNEFSGDGQFILAEVEL